MTYNQPLKYDIYGDMIYCGNCRKSYNLKKNGDPPVHFVNHISYCGRWVALTEQDHEQLAEYVKQKKAEKEAFEAECVIDRQQRQERLGQVQTQINEIQDQLAEKEKILAKKMAKLRRKLGIDELSASLVPLVESRNELDSPYNRLCKHHDHEAKHIGYNDHCYCNICKHSWVEEHEYTVN